MAVSTASAGESSREEREAEVLSGLEVRVTRKKFPVAGATVTITDDDPEARDFDPQTTKASGSVRFQVRPGATLEIRAAVGPDQPLLTKTVTALAAGESLTIRMELASDIPTETISVRVTGIPDGLPIEGAVVSALRGNDDIVRQVGKTVATDARGFAELPYAPELRYEGVARGASPWTVDAPADSGSGAAIALVRHARLHGKIEAPAGGFVGFSVFANGSPGLGLYAATVFVDDLSEHTDEPPNDWHRGYIQQQARIDRNGHWEIRSIAFGRGAEPKEGVNVWLTSEGARQRIAKGLTVRSGDNLLVVGPEGSPLNASLVFADGTPLSHGFLTILRPRDTHEFVHSARRWTRVAGGLDFAYLPHGGWDIYTYVDDPLADDLLVGCFEHKSAEDRRIVITGVVPVHGQVLGLQLEVEEAAELILKGLPYSGAVAVESDGRFEFTPMPPGTKGTFTLTVWRDPTLSPRAQTDLTATESETTVTKDFPFTADGKEIRLEY